MAVDTPKDRKLRYIQPTLVYYGPSLRDAQPLANHFAMLTISGKLNLPRLLERYH